MLNTIKATSQVKAYFYKIPIIRMSLICLISAILLGLIFMTVTKIPSWIGIIVCDHNKDIYCLSFFPPVI